MSEISLLTVIHDKVIEELSEEALGKFDIELDDGHIHFHSTFPTEGFQPKLAQTRKTWRIGRPSLKIEMDNGDVVVTYPGSSSDRNGHLVLSGKWHIAIYDVKEPDKIDSLIKDVVEISTIIAGTNEAENMLRDMARRTRPFEFFK
jgi:hypothetical protein